MKVDREIKLRPPDFLDQFHDARDRNQLWAIAQCHAVDAQRLVRVTRKTNNLSARLANDDSDARTREAVANCAQRGQAQHYVAKLAEVDDENVVGFETHFKLKAGVSSSGIKPLQHVD